IPVILSDRRVELEDDSLYTCWVGSDFEAEGRAAGEWLVDYLKRSGRGEEEIYIVTLQGTTGSSAQLGRTNGFAEVLKAQENWTMLELQDADFTQTKGREVMEDFLKNYDCIDVVISENDNMSFGAVDAIKVAGLSSGSYGDMIIISYDATSTALEMMLDGDINMDVECNPLLAPLVDEIIERLERGEAVEKTHYVEEQYFDTAMELESIIEGRAY
ncbi:MAG: substrate-binding domain-containing protein, partial [Lachnospiraceae bacterium]|nr:substrate-binding domain-containing protein [Lachnospiraceae bacterium]